MNPPWGLSDPRVLEQEPLCTYITLYEESAGSRSLRKSVTSSFVKAMQKDDRVALISKEWAYWTFEGQAPPGEISFEVTDDGEQLFDVFLNFLVKFSQALQKVDFRGVLEFQSHVVRRGLDAIKLKYPRPGIQGSTQGGSNVDSKNQSNKLPGRISRRKKHRLRAETDDHHSHKGDPMTSSESLSSSASSLTQLSTMSDFSTELSVLLDVGEPSKHSTSRKGKKRKPSSQKPPVVTPSDASEEEPSESKIPAVNSISHRPKRTTPNPCRPPRTLPLAKVQVAKKGIARRLKTTRQEDTGSSQSSLSTSPSGKLKKGRRGAGFPPSRRNGEKVSNVLNRLTRANSKLKRLRRAKSTSDLSSRARKKLRCSSMPVLDDEFEGILWAMSHQKPVVQKARIADRPLRKNLCPKSKPQKKRTRPEFETGSITSDENAQIDYCENLGPDIRPFRPLPRKVRNERVLPAADEDASVREISSVVPSLEDADQLLRDVASNALAVLGEGIGPDMRDWTQDKDLDAECEDPEDLEEMDDIQITTTSSVSSTVTQKPRVPAPPQIWAQSRQEVCESFEHFRSYHSGVYSKDDIVKGYLLGAHAASRDIFHHGGKLIISHGGGKSESILDTRRGPKRFQTDQDQEATDKSVRALLKTWQDRRPLVLLADDKYALFPYDLTSSNYTYVVLGLYWIAHAWAERQSTRDGLGRIVRWKFAFQWCEGQGDPWWTPQQEVMDAALGSRGLTSGSMICFAKDPSRLDITENSYIQCGSCQEQSPFVYKQGWMCLNPRCDAFWAINDEEPKELDYREEFLSLSLRTFERLPNITPPRVVETPSGVTTTFAFSKGWHCPECGRLSCRYKWEHWECSNCGFKYIVKGRIRSPKEFWHQRPPKEFLHSQIGKESGILACRLEPINLGERRGFTNRLTFILPHDRGKIHLILGTPLSNGSADSIFNLYQQQASTAELKLRRYPLRNHRARGLLLTNYFSQNSGEPYQYVGGTGNTVPFDEAPECVRQALAVIKERARLALHVDIPFNEVLSAAYMEKQKMSFHSDSEKGLGPVVASLSLGSAALMHFRLHVNAGDPKGKSSYALTLVLRHGDVLVMEGDGVQKYYEHTVVPMNFRIAATARCIGST